MDHRLSIVGGDARVLFPPATLPLIYKYTGGIPRLINTLCDTALTCAYADELRAATPDVIETAVRELQWPSFAERMDRRRQKAEGTLGRGGSLAAIAEGVRKLEGRSVTLEFIARNLALVESHLRNLLSSGGIHNRSDSTSDQRKKSG
jgi:hypothetical protein